MSKTLCRNLSIALVLPALVFANNTTNDQLPDEECLELIEDHSRMVDSASTLVWLARGVSLSESSKVARASLRRLERQVDGIVDLAVLDLQSFSRILGHLTFSAKGGDERAQILVEQIENERKAREECDSADEEFRVGDFTRLEVRHPKPHAAFRGRGAVHSAVPPRRVGRRIRHYDPARQVYLREDAITVHRDGRELFLHVSWIAQSVNTDTQASHARRLILLLDRTERILYDVVREYRFVKGAFVDGLTRLGRNGCPEIAAELAMRLALGRRDYENRDVFTPKEVDMLMALVDLAEE